MGRKRNKDLPLASYAAIGDRKTAALVAIDGSVDWMCHGRFDGPAVFCRLLDAGMGGYLQVAPNLAFDASHDYVGRSNVLATDFVCATGAMRVTDCMPLAMDAGSMLLRKLEGISGEVPVRVDFVPTFDFARARTTVEIHAGGCSAHAGDARLRLSCTAPMEPVAGGATSSFPLGAGETRWVMLTHGAEPPDEEAAEHAVRSTLDAWELWAARVCYVGPYENLVQRSALALQLLIHSPTGAMVAAPTTSLPEEPGGVRNWDYRFTWLRDTSWVVRELMELDYHDESMAFIDWLESTLSGEKRPAVFYDLDGNVPGHEQELTHLRGYRGARPVRVGNAAACQEQHDVFGEVIAAIHMCSDSMSAMRPLRPGLWKLVTFLADQAAARWQHPDHGIWEVRHRKRHFLSSKLLCWTALDRALAIARRDHLSGPLDRWEKERSRIRQAILSQGYDTELGSFKRAFDEAAPDASGLLLSHYGMLAADDPRVVRTVELIRQRLSAGGGLLMRYVAPDGLPGSEGAFTACSFWLVDSLAEQGRIEEGHRLFEQVIGYASDTGLMSEEICPRTGALLGNHPQAFTHLALIRAATGLAEAEQRSRAAPARESARAAAHEENR